MEKISRVYSGMRIAADYCEVYSLNAWFAYKLVQLLVQIRHSKRSSLSSCSPCDFPKAEDLEMALVTTRSTMPEHHMENI
jgi:hypothetical protein